MKATHLTFLISGLALAGAAPFAGFFSKDEIIAEVFHAADGGDPFYLVCGAVGLLTAFITALYTGRQYAQIFGGKPRDEHLHEHAHESPAVMTIPLYILAIGAAFAGFLGVPHIPGVPEALHGFANWLEPVFHPEAGGHGAVVHAGVNWILLGLGLVIGWGGWLIGRGLGLKQGERAALPESTERFSLDAIYRGVFGRAGLGFAGAMRWFDDRIIDGVVNGVGSVVNLASDALRLTQTSFVRNYALAMALGAAVVIGFFLSVSPQ